MRIIGGRLGGRRFNPPLKKWPTRPTTDFAKEALFNILQNLVDFEELKILDLFGGTGSLSLEFISRGCNDVTYVDKYLGCIKYVKQIASEFNIETNINIVKSDVFKYIETSKESYNLIFADPPYALSNLSSLPVQIFKTNILLDDGVFILEHDQKYDLKEVPFYFDTRHYGGVFFSFFRK